jgi:hypothetical protein
MFKNPDNAAGKGMTIVFITWITLKTNKRVECSHLILIWNRLEPVIPAKYAFGQLHPIQTTFFKARKKVPRADLVLAYGVAHAQQGPLAIL